MYREDGFDRDAGVEEAVVTSDVFEATVSVVTVSPNTRSTIKSILPGLLDLLYRIWKILVEPLREVSGVGSVCGSVYPSSSIIVLHSFASSMAATLSKNTVLASPVASDMMAVTKYLLASLFYRYILNPHYI